MNRRQAFWDSSALVPFCLLQQSSPAHYRFARDTTVVVWWGTLVEVHGAIVRVHASEINGKEDRRGALERLDSLRDQWLEIAPSSEVRQLALRELGLGGLRAADALQLAAALVWCRERPRGELFLTGDQRLATAAERSGFEVVLL